MASSLALLTWSTPLPFGRGEPLTQGRGPEGSGVGNHAGHLLVVGVGNQNAVSELAFGFRLLRREDVPHFGLAAHKFARGRLFEALGSAPMRFEFGHGDPD